MIIMYNGLVGC